MDTCSFRTNLSCGLVASQTSGEFSFSFFYIKSSDAFIFISSLLSLFSFQILQYREENDKIYIIYWNWIQNWCWLKKKLNKNVSKKKQKQFTERFQWSLEPVPAHVESFVFFKYVSVQKSHKKVWVIKFVSFYQSNLIDVSIKKCIEVKWMFTNFFKMNIASLFFKQFFFWCLLICSVWYFVFDFCFVWWLFYLSTSLKHPIPYVCFWFWNCFYLRGVVLNLTQDLAWRQ